MCTSPTASMGNAISRHYNDVIMGTMTSQITGVSIVCLTVCSGEDERKHQSYVSLAYVRGIHQWPVDSLHRGPVTRKMFPFDDVIVKYRRGSRFDVLWCGFWQVDFTHILHDYFISVKMGSVMRGYFHMKLWGVKKWRPFCIGLNVLSSKQHLTTGHHLTHWRHIVTPCVMYLNHWSR